MNYEGRGRVFFLKEGLQNFSHASVARILKQPQFYSEAVERASPLWKEVEDDGTNVRDRNTLSVLRSVGINIPLPILQT